MMKVPISCVAFWIFATQIACAEHPSIGRPFNPVDGPPKGFQIVVNEDCGVPGQQPHKVRGRDSVGKIAGLPADSPLLTYNVADNWDRAVVYRFEGISPEANYKLRVALLSAIGMTEQITANRDWLYVAGKGTEPIFSISLRANEPTFLEFDLNPTQLAGGVLELRFANREGWPAVVSMIELWADHPVKLAPPQPPARIPDYASLATSAWKPLGFEGRPFFFLTYDKVSLHKPNALHGRFAYEAELQHVLSPVWNYENFSLAEDGKWAGVAEWGYGIALDGECKPDCYESRRRWFTERLTAARAAGKKFHSFTGHEWLEPYAAMWGADRLTTELGAGSPCVQARIALLRGAARQHGIPFAVQTSPWYGGKIPHYEDGEGEEVSRRGHSAAFQARTWYLAWLSGASYVTPEACQLALFQRLPEQRGTKPAPPVTRAQPTDKRFKLSPLGVKAQQFVRHIEQHPDIGVPFTPFALIVDQYSGFHVTPGAGQVRPWWRLEPTPGDLEIATFLNTIFPRTILYKPGDKFSESRLMVNAPYGETFDILLSDVQPQLLNLYPVAILLGDHALTPTFRATVLAYLKQGGHLILTPRLAGQLGTEIASFRQAGRIAIEEFARNERAVRELMDPLAENYLPLKVQGDIQFTINRTQKGWLIGLIENKGAWREESGAMVLNPATKAIVTLAPKQGTLKSASNWSEESAIPISENAVKIAVPPGDIRVVELYDR